MSRSVSNTFEGIWGLLGGGYWPGVFPLFGPLDRGHQLHAVVGRFALASRELLLDLAHAQQRAPAALAGIALAGPVGENQHMLHANIPGLAA